jgi:hypothetical protein
MRLLLHLLVTLTAAAVLGGLALFYAKSQQTEAEFELARQEVSRFQQQIHLQTALASSEDQSAQPPASVDPTWFEGDVPRNPLLGPEHPWVEIAGPEMHDRLHPFDLAAADESVATFWYNPYLGVVRARVPVGISDLRTLERYNNINDSALPSLFPEP